MKDILYIPVSSQNFNSIFSTESIMPGAYYKERRFGGRRFFYNSANSNENATLLYSFLPKVEPGDADTEAFVFYIGIRTDVLNDTSVIVDDGKNKVISCSEIIYLNFCDPIFIFNNESQKELAIAKSLSALETKTIDKYYPRFITSELLKLDTKEFSIKESILNSIPHREYDRDRDISINSYKGLIYTHLASTFLKKSDKALEINNATREINNAIGAYTSALSTVERKGKSTRLSFKKDENIENAHIILDKAFDHLIFVTSKYLSYVRKKEKIKKLFADKQIDDNEANVIFGIFSRIPELEERLYDISELYDPSIQFELYGIKKEIKQLASYSQIQAKSRTLNKIQLKLDHAYRRLKEISNDNSISSHEDLSAFLNTYKYEDGEILFEPTIVGLDQKQSELHTVIINTLFQKNKSTTESVSSEFLNDLIIEVGNTVTDIFGEASQERIFLLQFYSFLNGKDQTFRIQLIKSIVLANFAAFILKHKSLEELLDFCEKQYVPSYSFAVEYWGVFNGFASIGKIYTKPLWINDRKELVTKLDEKFKDELLVTTHASNGIKIQNLNEGLIQEALSNRPKTVVDFLKPVLNDWELRKFINWIEKCTEDILCSIIMEYEGMGPVDSIRKDFAAELFSKNKPKGFMMYHIEKIITKLDFELLEKLKRETQGIK